MAIQRRRPAAGLIHHSDRGSQHAAGNYCKILQAAAILQSMSRKANCWDNAPMESFFGTLKTEFVHYGEYPDRDAARRDLFAYIEGYTAAEALRDDFLAFAMLARPQAHRSNDKIECGA